MALKYLYGDNGRITKDRGRWFDTKYGLPAIATYHPAYLLRLTGQDLVKAKWEVYYDLKAAAEKCNELMPDYVLKAEAPANLLEIYSPRKKQRLVNPN